MGEDRREGVRRTTGATDRTHDRGPGGGGPRDQRRGGARARAAGHASHRTGGRHGLRAPRAPVGRPPADQTELVEALREQISDLRVQLAEANAANRENRRIIAGLTQRIPELEAASPSEPSDAPETVEEEPERVEPRSGTGGAQEDVRRPWWRRVFGG